MPAVPLAWRLDDAGYLERVARVRAAIAAGDVYQVNLTLRAEVLGASGARLSGAQLLTSLCRRGVPRFAAWVRWPDGSELVSASPELLCEIEGRRIRAEPMKGTAAAGCRAALEESDKDRAELAMITDLLRDDLQRLCVRRSVQVPAPRRFVELPYAVQAVSDVTGLLRDGVGVAEVLAQLHPGGSVTGAPRPVAREAIAALESTPRGAYCGVLGLERDSRARVALLIRTAQRAARVTADGPWIYGTGGGITWDSDAVAELDEIRVKMGALA